MRRANPRRVPSDSRDILDARQARNDLERSPDFSRTQCRGLRAPIRRNPAKHRPLGDLRGHQPGLQVLDRLHRHMAILLVLAIFGLRRAQRHPSKGLARDASVVAHLQRHEFGTAQHRAVRDRHHGLVAQRPQERTIRKLVKDAAENFEMELAEKIGKDIDAATLERWPQLLTEPRPDGQTLQSWLWAAPAKHSTPQIEEVHERIEYLYGLGIQSQLTQIPDPILRRYARRLSSRPPSISARAKEPARMIEVVCFLRYCLLSATDQLILMIRRRIADLARKAGTGVDADSPWKKLFCSLLDDLQRVVRTQSLPDRDLRESVVSMEARYSGYRPPSRASIVRERLIETVRGSRSLLQVVVQLPWQSQADHPVTAAIAYLRECYAKDVKVLPEKVPAWPLGIVWKPLIEGDDRERAFRALEVATLSSLRRAVRNGSVWIDHSLSFRSREHLFIAPAVWKADARKHYLRLKLPVKASDFLDPLLERVRQGVDVVAQATDAGRLQIDDALHLEALKAEEEAPEIQSLRTRLDQRIGEAQLPDLLLEIDAKTRFSWIMLGREPRTAEELLMVYAGVIAPGDRAVRRGNGAHDPAAISPERASGDAMGGRRATPRTSQCGRADFHAAARHR
jgi:hypothetical protein